MSYYSASNNVQVREALKRLVTYALRTNFSVEELETIVASGITIAELVNGGTAFYLDQERCQKGSLALMSRFPFTDEADVAMFAGGVFAGQRIKRRALGAVGKDSLGENIIEGLLSSADLLKDKFASIFTDSSLAGNVEYFDETSDRPVDGSMFEGSQFDMTGVSPTFAPSRGQTKRFFTFMASGMNGGPEEV